jgi:hypothetical protein
MQQVGAALIALLLLFAGKSEAYGRITINHEPNQDFAGVIYRVGTWLCGGADAGTSYFSTASRVRRRSLSQCSDRLAAAGLELSAGKTD